MLDARLQKLPVASHRHHHEHHQIVVGVQGKADLSIDGKESRLDTWKACLVPTEARHDYCGDDQNHVLVIDLDPGSPAFNSSAHSDYDRLAPLFERPRTIDLENRLQALVQLAAGEFDRAPDNGYLKHHLAASILHCMVERVHGSRETGGRNTVNPEAIRRYVSENLHRKITVQDMAAESCLSVSRFHDLFRDATGITPHQFLLQSRLEQAAHYLTSTSLPISEVSYRTGFSSQSALTNAFRKYRGTTPAKLRFGDAVA